MVGSAICMGVHMAVTTDRATVKAGPSVGPAFFVGCQFITPFLIGCIYAGIILVLVIIDVEPVPA